MSIELILVEFEDSSVRVERIGWFMKTFMKMLKISSKKAYKYERSTMTMVYNDAMTMDYLFNVAFNVAVCSH